MRWTVTCPPEVQDELALLWVQAADKAAVSRASDEIDRILRSSPLSRGIDRGDHWTLTVDPLTAVYTISPDDCQVTILQFILQE